MMLLYLKIKQGLTDSLQLLGYSLVFTHLTFIPYVHASPTGGNITGGAGDINHSGLTTTINQKLRGQVLRFASTSQDLTLSMLQVKT